MVSKATVIGKEVQDADYGTITQTNIYIYAFVDDEEAEEFEFLSHSELLSEFGFKEEKHQQVWVKFIDITLMYLIPM